MNKWYQKWWGKLIIILLLLFLIILALFSWKIFSLVQEIKTGELSPAILSGLLALPQTPVENSDLLTVERTSVESATSPFKGSKDASIVIVEFSDFSCSFCGQAYPIVRELMTSYKNEVKFIFRNFPLKLEAQAAALAAQCAHEQDKFWPFHDKLFQNQSNLTTSDLKFYAQQVGLEERQFNECLDSAKYLQVIKKDLSDGLAAGASGTPTFFINGLKIEGLVPLEFFKLLIEELKGADQ